MSADEHYQAPHPYYVSLSMEHRSKKTAEHRTSNHSHKHFNSCYGNGNGLAREKEHREGKGREEMVEETMKTNGYGFLRHIPSNESVDGAHMNGVSFSDVLYAMYLHVHMRSVCVQCVYATHVPYPNVENETESFFVGNIFIHFFFSFFLHSSIHDGF